MVAGAVPTLMRHQEEGVDFLLARRSGLLAFEQGLGKTLVALEAFRRLRRSKTATLMVVICPNSLKRNWREEAARFFDDLRVRIVGGTANERRRDLTNVSEDIVVINYEAARSEVMALRAVMTVKRTVLVIDESHNVKNRESLTSIAARHLAPHAEYRWLLTGTPVTNRPEDIFSQLEVVRGRTDMPLKVFMLDYGKAADDPDVYAKLSDEIAPFLLRKTKEDCLDLPSKTFIDLEVRLPSWQRALYDDMRDGMIRQVKAMSPDSYAAFASTALTRLLRLSQIASNPGLVYPGEARLPGKVAELDGLMEELVRRSDRKVIIWSHYVGTIRNLLDRYYEYGAVALYGEVPVDGRQAIAHSFQEDPATRVLIANPAAAGTGFTLTAATYAIYETLSWRYDFYAQSQDRIHRIGQVLPVTYLRLIAEDTIDRLIAESLERKAAMAKMIVGDDATSLSITDLQPEEFCRMLQTNQLPSKLEA